MPPRSSPPTYSSHQRHPHQPWHHRAKSTYTTISSKSPPPPDKTTTLKDKDWLVNGKRSARNDQQIDRASAAHQADESCVQRQRTHQPSKVGSLDGIEWGEDRVEDHTTTSKHGCEPAYRIPPQQLQTHLFQSLCHLVFDVGGGYCGLCIEHSHNPFRGLTSYRKCIK